MRHKEKISLIQRLAIYLFVVVFTFGFSIFRVFLSVPYDTDSTANYACKTKVAEKGCYKIFPSLKRLLVVNVKSIKKAKLVNPRVTDVTKLNYLNKFGLNEIYPLISGYHYLNIDAKVNCIRSESILTSFGSFII